MGTCNLSCAVFLRLVTMPGCCATTKIKKELLCKYLSSISENFSVYQAKLTTVLVICVPLNRRKTVYRTLVLKHKLSRLKLLPKGCLYGDSDSRERRDSKKLAEIPGVSLTLGKVVGNTILDFRGRRPPRTPVWVSWYTRQRSETSRSAIVSASVVLGAP